MKFDYTKGKPETNRVSIRYLTTTDSYRFSDYNSAKALFDSVLSETMDELVTIRLLARKSPNRGFFDCLEKFTKDDELKAPWGLLLAEYDYCRNVIYIRSDCILPHTKVDRATFSKAFAKTYEQRIEDYATDVEKALIKAFIEMHKGAKLSEFTTLH